MTKIFRVRRQERRQLWSYDTALARPERDFFIEISLDDEATFNLFRTELSRSDAMRIGRALIALAHRRDPDTGEPLKETAP